MGDAQPLNLIWRRGVLDGVLEAQFLRQDVMGSLARPQRWIALEDGQPLPDLDDLLICSFGDCGAVLQSLRGQGRHNIGVLHLGDETGRDDLGFYADADYIIRNYFRAGLPAVGGYCRRILWIPNGWAAGVGPVDPARHLSFDGRRHELFFAGHAGTDTAPLPDRKAMLDALRARAQPATVLLTDGFGQGLGAQAYAGYLADARFALAPAGNAPETIRFYDALECGALPIVTDAPWLHDPEGAGGSGPPPVPILAGWNDLTAKDLGRYGEDDRTRAVDWWQALKARTAARVSETIEAAFAS